MCNMFVRETRGEYRRRCHHIKRLSEKQSLLCCCEFAGTRDLVLSPRDLGTSSCGANWYGQSIWFQLLGKLVPWRERHSSVPPSLPSPLHAGQRQTRTRQNECTNPEWRNPPANTAVSVAGGRIVEMLSVFFFLFPTHHSGLTTVPLTLRSSPRSLSLYPLRATIPSSVALGMYLPLEGLQSDGCERVSREEEEEADG